MQYDKRFCPIVSTKFSNINFILYSDCWNWCVLIGTEIKPCKVLDKKNAVILDCFVIIGKQLLSIGRSAYRKFICAC